MNIIDHYNHTDMKNQIDYSGFIERFLNNRMDQEEIDWFNEEMEINPALTEEVQMQQDIGKAILNGETLAFRAQISNLFEKEETGKPGKIRRSIRIPAAARMAVASLAALIMLGSGLYFYFNRTVSPDKLFDTYYQPYEGLMNVRSSNSQMTDMLVMAMHKYEQQDFESALILFETVLANDRDNITSKFYSGISYMETGRYGIAQKSFTGIVDHNDNLFIEHAEWYLGLCYIKTGDKDRARSLFKSIADSDGYYSRPSRRLLRNL